MACRPPARIVKAGSVKIVTRGSAGVIRLERRRMSMRKLLIGGALGALVIALVGRLPHSLRRLERGQRGRAVRPPRRPDARRDRSHSSCPGPAEGSPRGARLDRGQEHRAHLAQPRAGAGRGAGEAFVRERVDVIVAFEDQSIDAAKAATASIGADRIPVVFLHPSDPLADGLAKSLSRPGGNLTGVFGPRDVVAKQLELYQLLVPRLRRVLTLVDPTDPRTERTPEAVPERGGAAATTARAGHSGSLDAQPI